MSFTKPVFESVSCRPIGDADRACEDCAYYLASDGDTPDEPSEGWSPPEIDSDIKYRQVDGSKGFSWSACDICGQPLGGDRYDFEQLEFGDFWQWRLSAPGYTDCTDWSYADSLQEAISDCWLLYSDGFDQEDLLIIAEALGDDFAAFRRGYFLAIGFTASDEEGGSIFSAPGQEFSDAYDSSEIESAAKDSGQFEQMLGDAIDFYIRHRADIAKLGCDFESAGSLFHYARNGHGVSWSDDFTDPMADTLQEASKRFGELEFQA